MEIVFLFIQYKDLKDWLYQGINCIFVNFDLNVFGVFFFWICDNAYSFILLIPGLNKFLVWLIFFPQVVLLEFEKSYFNTNILKKTFIKIVWKQYFLNGYGLTMLGQFFLHCSFMSRFQSARTDGMSSILLTSCNVSIR